MKRFWNSVTIEDVGDGWRVLLDGRPIRTPACAPQIVPTRDLAEMLAGEWRAQEEEIDPAGFVLRDMADYAIDMVATDPAAVAAKLMRYGETDTLCYRADPDEPLHKRQWAEWEPIVTAFEAREGVQMERVSGIVPKSQPAVTLATLKARLERLDPFTLAALEVVTSLSGSLIVGLSTIQPDADLEALWAAAELEETWQAELWGTDWEAQHRSDRRKADFVRAVEFARASRTTANSAASRQRI